MIASSTTSTRDNNGTPVDGTPVDGAPSNGSPSNGSPDSASPADAPTIYRAGPAHYGDLRQLGALISDAFLGLSAVRWLTKDDRPNAPHVFARWSELHIADALQRGHVDLLTSNDSEDDPEPLAAAVWFTNPHAEPPRDYDQQLLRAVGRRSIDRFRTLDTVMADAHPGGQHHHHLLLIAVRPGLQGGGYGSALLAHHHRLLDDAGTPAYLEAASADSARLYLRHGYTHIGEPLTLPGNDSPGLWPMWREPKTLPTAS
ncbi:GNAT family N-acetyltransferase [Cryptosporangium phraense]|uniref:GNAT family N-acetyltransferase n=1 Tax=Cryptosporangium phraense TaxID=2593070 RepID=A0A545ANF5_9ACTN|nr:GNAT family N-acetyltransferase [Cryptosporangium phraense]TQS42803.1 GNAT family N-acetyltransferase [Cryptosporangium phraense]